MDEAGTIGMNVPAALMQGLLGQHDDGAAFRGLVGQRGEQRGLRQFRRGHARRGQEGGGLTVTQGDGAGLVEQQDVDVAGRLDRLAGGGDDVLGQHAAHAGHTDGGEQATDGGRNQADQ